MSELDIAVVGMAGRFPGAGDVTELWKALRAGTPGLRRTGVGGGPRHVPVVGVVEGAELFDARFFGYSPRDAAVLDPQQRVFLECAWHALEHAGHGGAGGAGGEVVGVYASASQNTYLLRNLLGNPSVPGGLSEMDLLLAGDKDTLATRVAYHLDLTGPAVTVQSACSSSLVAVHLAVQALLAGDCDVALAGGVSVRPPQDGGYEYQDGGILAPDGRCLPFDADARGVVPGNGVAAVVLRPLADARRDGDTVYAVLKGTAVNNDGAAKVGFTAPSVTGQAAVIAAAHEVSGVDPTTIGYVEAHGTGTALGDPVEVAALRAGFRAEPPSCLLGSVKALVGHLDAAAGVTGLVKAVLAVHHGVVPPSPYFRAANPDLGLGDGPFFVNREPTGWSLPGPRRAAVSGFGMGGTNAHAVLEQAPSAEPSGPARPRQLLVLAAATEAALTASRTALAGALTGPDAPPLADAAHTLRVGRATTHRHRLAVVAGDPAEAADALAGRTRGPLWTDEVGERPRLVFLFPGQGAQYAGMAAGLYEHEPVFRAAFDECADLLAGHGIDLRAVVHPAGESGGSLGRTRFAQPALFAVEYAVAALLRSWGVRPDAMLGHSVGEYTAACLAGVFTLPDALALVAERGRLMDRMPPGAMLAVPLGAADVVDLLTGRDGLCLAASNAPELSTVAGPAGVVDRFAASLAATGVTARRLHTSHAFHSAMLDPMLPELAARVAEVPAHEPGIPFAANVTGDWITAAQATDPGYWATHARAAVRFSEGLRTVLAHGPAVLVEVGPGTTLATLARRHGVADDGHRVVTTLPRPRAVGGDPTDDLTTALGAFGRLWAAGVEVDLAAPAAGERRHRVALPGYPFARERHWIDPPGTPERPAEVVAVPVAVGTAVEPAAGDPALELVTAVWRELLGLARVDPHDDFFELGGHSLLATQILARIADGSGVTLPAGALFEAPTPHGLARLLREHTPDPGPEPEQSELDRVLAEIRDLTPEQLRAELDREWHAQETSQP